MSVKSREEGEVDIVSTSWQPRNNSHGAVKNRCNFQENAAKICVKLGKVLEKS
jgi:hypothetical protein